MPHGVAPAGGGILRRGARVRRESTAMQKPDVSVVIPVYNERESLPVLHERLRRVLDGLGRSHEIILVDDGSTDGSVEIVEGLARGDASLRLVRLNRNFGQSPALYAGLSQSRGAYVIVMDADLQVLPEDIPLLVKTLDEGSDVVVGWRANRHDSPFRKAMSRLFNWYVARVTGLTLHDYGCCLKGMRREIVDSLCSLRHRCRYFPADLAMVGGRVTEVVVGHSERALGSSKYNFFKLLRVAFDMITSITDAPLRFIGLIGWLMAFAGFAMGAKVMLHRVMHGDMILLESVVAVFFFCSGIQLMATGMMCEYIGRIFIEVQRRPYFIIRGGGEGEKERDTP